MIRISQGTLAAAALLAASVAGAAPAPRTGAQVVEEQCALCHASGRDGAPRIGDNKAWAERAKRGLPGLTQTALEGIRKMPPHGGKLHLSDLEIQRAIAYMVNKSGGNWIEPVDRAALPKGRTGESIVKAKCVQCHGTGKDGAPMIGDSTAWVGRAKDGFDSLVRSAIHGHGAMPARGGMADLTDAEMRDAVTYMFQRSVKKE
jgi:cytochrome c5